MHACFTWINGFELSQLCALNIKVKWHCIPILNMLVDVTDPCQISNPLSDDENMIVMLMHACT